MGNRHSIKLTADGPIANLVIDGMDVSSNVMALDLRVDAQESPVLVLEVAAFPLGVEIENCPVYIQQGTRNLLIQLGWTPPEEETADVMD